MLRLPAAKLVLLALAIGLAGLAIGSRFRHDEARLYATVPVRLADGTRLNVGKFEVSFAEWMDCYGDGGCTWLPKAGLTPLPGRLPVVGVNAFDVAQYVAWYNWRMGSHYRLPSAQEWQMIAAGVRRTANVKLLEDPRLSWAADY